MVISTFWTDPRRQLPEPRLLRLFSFLMIGANLCKQGQSAVEHMSNASDLRDDAAEQLVSSSVPHFRARPIEEQHLAAVEDRGKDGCDSEEYHVTLEPGSVSSHHSAEVHTIGAEKRRLAPQM